MAIFLRINILHLILLCGLVSMTVCENDCTNGETSSSSRSDSQAIADDNSPTSLLSHLKLKIMTNAGHECLNLELVSRSLANKNLPVWIIQGAVVAESKDDYGKELILMPEVMDKLGEFTTYQESECISSAIYFHRRRQFYGVIDYRYLIQGLSIDDLHAKKENELWVDDSAIVARKKSMCHQKNRKRKHKVDGFFGEKMKKSRRIRSYSYDGYPEILVVVSWEMAQELIKTKSESERYTTIVSYVLTLFHAVDMLYSKLRETKIELNIAGIIFGIERESFAFMEKCITHERNIKEDKGPMTNTECSNSEIREYLYRRRRVIPVESYDIVVFLTRNRLFTLTGGNEESGKPKRKQLVKGQAAPYVEEIYKCRESNGPVVLVATVRDDGALGSYSTIAHESAHLMNVLHDPSPWIRDKCHANIMKKNDLGIGGGWCKTCLSWSDTSEKSFRAFFSSRNCCTFINEPRSLYPPGRRQMLTADKQCQCYGHESAMSSNRIRQSSKSSCQSRLQCRGADNIFHSTVLPMDGTLCADGKVCWKKLCRTVGDFKPSSH